MLPVGLEIGVDFRRNGCKTNPVNFFVVFRWFDHLAIKGFTGQGPYEKRFEVSPHLDSQNTDALPYLWARTRLARLTDFASRDNDEGNRTAVTQLGLTYNLLTAYTSFVAVHEQVRNTNGPAKDVDQPLPLPRGVSNLAVGGRNVPEPELGVLLSLLLACALLWRRRQRQQRTATFPLSS